MDRPAIRFVPISTDEGKIRFFGTLMPALLLLKASPLRFLGSLIARRTTPHMSAETLIASDTDDAAYVDGVLIFVHRWRSKTFDPFAFADAKTFLARLTRLVRRQGYQAEPMDPLSPGINLPRLAAQAGLGNLSPYGLLVHAAFGPRLILTGLRTDAPFMPAPRIGGLACDDCLACVRVCPQEPERTGVVELGLCQACARCLGVCPRGA